MSKLEMPHSEYGYCYDVLNVFQNILVVFYWNKREIYCLDLSNLKWYKSKCLIPKDLEKSTMNCYVIKMDTNAHIIDFHKNINSKVNIYDLIPREMMISRRKYYKPLIMGYVRQTENKLSLHAIPLTLQMLILNYFQLFS
eukprot:263493_1